jgi:hypothetical protein
VTTVSKAADAAKTIGLFIVFIGPSSNISATTNINSKKNYPPA